MPRWLAAFVLSVLTWAALILMIAIGPVVELAARRRRR